MGRGFFIVLDANNHIGYLHIMEYICEKVDTARLNGIIDLPADLRSYRQLEVTVRPPSADAESFKKARAARDIEIINKNAARFNREAEENLLFQAPL